MQRKGQAAMEFLMTYGWAILAAVVAIGVLAYFGVFSPGRYVSNVCTINAPFGCDEYAIAAGSLQLNIRNGGGESFDLASIAVDACTTNDNAGAGWTVPDGDTTGAVTITCTGLATGEKVKKDITISYTKTTGGTITQTATGTISGRVP
jgi:hypothetical protein